jgi:hypothetical protein
VRGGGGTFTEVTLTTYLDFFVVCYFNNNLVDSREVKEIKKLRGFMQHFITQFWCGSTTLRKTSVVETDPDPTFQVNPDPGF